MSDNSIINFGELSKPATVLVEKISDAIGGLFKPYQIVRVARAEAEAERVKAESQIEISDLQRRAFYRFLEEEAKKQKNMEDITQGALPQLEETSRPSEVDDDWIANFFDRCRLVSDKEMQGLWSRVLAGEANSPGSYSKRTVNLLSGLDKTDAALFTSLCGFGWVIGHFDPVVYDYKDEIYNKQGITFDALSHLESIGLIHLAALTGFMRVRVPKELPVLYYGASVTLRFRKDADNSVDIGMVMLTRVGEELAPICGSGPVEGFVDYVRNKWIKLGYIRAEKAERHAAPNGPSAVAPSP